MTSAVTGRRLGYGEARTLFGTHPIRVSEIPVEYAISLPVPTLRCGAPGYAGFAGAARRAPDTTGQLRPPDRWWVLSAERRALLTYSLTVAVPFTDDLPAEVAVLPPVARSVAEIQEDLRLLDSLMDRAAGEFFAETPADVGLATDLIAVLTALVSKVVMDWYRRLAPDFFGWLVAPVAGSESAEKTGKESRW